MKKIKLTNEEIETMNYNDVAYIILEKNNEKMKIIDLFNEVVTLLKLNPNEAESHIADFFELLSTDKRFIMLDGGYWDLKIKHNKGMIIEENEDDDDDDIVIEPEEETEEDDMYDDKSEASDDDVAEDDLADLVIIDDADEENNL